MIDIITVNFNNCLGLKRTLDSLVSQTQQPANVFVIDGASSDNSLDVAFSYQKSLNLTLVSEPDSGIYDAMNKGILLLKSRYCLFLNSGDELFDSFSIFKALDLSVSIFCFSSCRIYNRITYSAPAKPIQYLKYGMITNHQSIIYSSQSLRRHPYCLSYKIAADYHQSALFFTLGYHFVV